ncbi:non-ribosomal peptide synthetase [Kitasatospora sp. MAP5-34]|uniref:non-ribosomal peptide synthetase n=1 Tax=Kitasatospora sp. MAP5-34 TaxID=3035102 RepID=UPI00247422AF|nr:non-ribosomal peptide synthetase [Kitasatospora sp. MAP5-34]MDH6577276.1 amino acid adenylation domain-containing protein [Kitasatospora sp. MAP5-34]
MTNPDAVLSITYGGPHQDAAVLDRHLDWVRRTPDAPALLDGEHSWSYAELDRLAAALADTLRDRVRPGELVGVCLDHSAALVTVALAVARLGAVYLPLGPRPGERRLQAVAENLRLACLIGDPALLPPTHRDAAQLPLALPTEGANAAATVVAAFAPAAPDAVGAPAGSYYAVLTSGSTGTPKAVAVGESSLGALLRWYQGLTGLGPGDRHSLMIGVAFDPHLQELWATLTSGAALSVAPDEVRWDPGALTGWWQRAGITVGVLPAPLAEPVLGLPWPSELTLRHLTVGGDRLRRRPAPDVTAQVHNAYGPAEATVTTTVHTMPPGAAPDGPDAPPIGLPLPGVTVFVTDEDGRPVPRGTSGELRIGGRLLSLGYLDRELTARRFMAAPAGAEGVDRVYRTGDRVLMRPDGVLEFQGRLDDQVKVSGVRIEPAEVEAALERDPRVRRATVAARYGADGGVQLVAFVQRLADGEPSTGAELLPQVREWLPVQAVPTRIRLVDAFPLDANGKVDRTALLADLESSPTTDDGSTQSEARSESPTASATERTVLRLCRELLGNPALGPQDNFIDAGGNSLATSRLLVALKQECGVELRAPQLLRQPDLRRLAELVESRRPSAVTVTTS